MINHLLHDFRNLIIFMVRIFSCWTGLQTDVFNMLIQSATCSAFMRQCGSFVSDIEEAADP